MTPRIKVTGYVDTDDLHGEAIDLENPTGLSESGLKSFTEGRDGAMAIMELDELNFTLVEDDEDDDVEED